jgi:maleylacetate reductase
VTFGGGSVTDTGKMVSLALKHDLRRVEDFDPFVVRVKPDGSRVTPDYADPDVRQIAIPTTLSGGDFNRSAGCTDPRSRLKEIYRHPALVPRAVILDPAVTTRTPDWLWLSTGIRALDHAVETVCAAQADFFARAPSLQAIWLLASALPRTRANPADLQARLDAQLAVWLAMEHNRLGVPMGASHGVDHVLGGTCNVPHGYTSCIMLPVVLKYNESVNGDRQRMVSEALGRPGVAAFVRGLGLPTSLTEVGVGPDQYDAVARASLLDHYVHTNPRPIARAEDILEILRKAS